MSVSYTHLDVYKRQDLVTAVEKTKGTNIHVGAENVHFEKSGAFTGEILSLIHI